jgi:two-component system nitrate/nitrite response regulator NarL
MSSRQREVLELIAIGDSIKAIARKLDLAEGTVKAHIAAIYRKLGVNNRVGAARALAQGQT